MKNKLPAIDIKGKQYVQVKDRVIYFNETFTDGSIETEILSDLYSKNVVVKATVIPDTRNLTRRFVAHSQATVGQGMVNTTAALENAETSAVGRALGLMGIGVIESIASADEMNKALNSEKFSAGQSAYDAPRAHTQSTGEDINQDRCPHCGSTTQFHSKNCPSFKAPKGEII